MDESVLRDIDREQSKMQDDVENFVRHYGKLQEYVREYIERTTVEWARLVANHPKTVLLVVETTRVVNERGYSYGNNNEPIRLTALYLATGEVWDQLLSPTHSSQVQGTEYHGLSLTDLEGKPRLADVWPQFQELIKDYQMVIFGAEYARKAVQSAHPAFSVFNHAYCLHDKCKEYYGEFYYLSLEKVLGYQGIGKQRSDLTDSRERIAMLAQVLQNIAEGKAKQESEPEPEGTTFFADDHPF